MNSFIFPKVLMGEKLKCNLFTFSKNNFLCKILWTFYPPYLKDLQNANVKWKLPSHTYLVLQITSLLVGFGGFLCPRTDCQWVELLLTGSFLVLWGCVETDGLSCSAVVPVWRQIFFGMCCLPIIQSSEESLRSSGTVRAGIYCDRGASTRDIDPLSNTECWAGSITFPFAGISIEKCISYTARLQFPSSKWRARVYYPRAHASLIHRTVYISKETCESGPSWHLNALLVNLACALC